MARGRYIKLVLVTDDSRIESVIKAPHVTSTMIAAAYEFIRVLSTGEAAAPTDEDKAVSK